jgi:hypothetical protein
MISHVDVVTICQFHGLRTCPESPLKNLIPLVREMTKLRIVFEVTVSLSHTECKTVTRIHRSVVSDEKLSPLTLSGADSAPVTSWRMLGR